MPLSKSDNPEAPKATEPDGSPKKVTGPGDAATRDAVEGAIDAAAGAPASQREAAEALPERNEVQSAIKAAMLATDAQTEAQEKAKVVEASVDSAETPSGAALLASADIADDVERAEEYARVKAGVRHGTTPPPDAKPKE